MRKDWEIKKLCEVLVKTETIDPRKKSNETFIYLDVSSVNKETKEIDNATVLLGKDAPSRARKLVRTNDVIFATVRPTHSRVALITQEYNKQVCSTGYFVLRGKDFIFNKYLFYFLLTDEFNEQMEKMQKGASYPAVTDTDVKSIALRYPKSLPEQQRIVAILDETFAAIDKAKANAEQNLKNAKELFDCTLDNILYNKKWIVKELGEVCSRVEYGSSTKSTPEGKLPVLRMGNIQNGSFTWDSLVYSDDEEDNTKYLLKHNDVLFNRTNSPELVGKTAIYKSEMPSIFAGYLIRIHRKANLLDADYLNYYLNSKMAKDYGNTVVISSVNQANINGTKLKSYPIPLPSLKDQQIIVQKLDALSIETKKLESIYQQ